jgi:hypothetical protein
VNSRIYLKIGLVLGLPAGLGVTYPWLILVWVAAGVVGANLFFPPSLYVMSAFAILGVTYLLTAFLFWAIIHRFRYRRHA